MHYVLGFDGGGTKTECVHQRLASADRAARSVYGRSTAAPHVRTITAS